MRVSVILRNSTKPRAGGTTAGDALRSRWLGSGHLCTAVSTHLVSPFSKCRTFQKWEMHRIWNLTIPCLLACVPCDPGSAEIGRDHVRERPPSARRTLPEGRPPPGPPLSPVFLSLSSCCIYLVSLLQPSLPL